MKGRIWLSFFGLAMAFHCACYHHNGSCQDLIPHSRSCLVH